MLRELAQQQELEAGQRHRPLPDVRDQPADIEGHLAGPDHLTVRLRCELRSGQRRHERLELSRRFGCGPVVGMVRLGAEPDADPGEQLGEGEGLGEVVLRAALEQVDLGGHVGDAGQHDHGLVRARGEQLPQHLAAVHVADHQVEDDQVVAARGIAAQGIGAAARELRRVAGGSECPADKRTDLGLVIHDKDPPSMRHVHLPRPLRSLPMVSVAFSRVNWWRVTFRTCYPNVAQSIVFLSVAL